MTNNNPMIRLISPNIKSDELVFYWQQNAKVATEENKFIVNTIHWVINDVDEINNDTELLELYNKVDIKSYSSVKEFSEIFNRKIISLKEEWMKNKVTPAFLNRRADRHHLHHVIEYCYSKAVEEPDKLNQYVPFSAEVYGETSFELVDQIINWVQFKPDDVFIDLGSGVGQVVLQVASSTDCKSCAGIEKADYPAKCSIIMEQEFRKLMLYFGKPYNPFTLIKGDFLADEHQETISNSTVIFANNFAFGPLVDHQLKNRFTSLKEGAKIISSKAFCPLKFRITDRNLDDICSIMRVTTRTCLTGRVSWTNNSINYFVQEIDRSMHWDPTITTQLSMYVILRFIEPVSLDIGSIMRVQSLTAMENAVSWTCSPFSYYLHQVDHSMLEDYFAKYKQNRENEDNSNGSRSQKQKQLKNETAANGNSDHSSSKSLSLDRSLQLHNEPANRHHEAVSRRLTKSMDNKKDSPGRRASERLLRCSKKRPLYSAGLLDESTDSNMLSPHGNHGTPGRKRGRMRKNELRSSADGKQHQHQLYNHSDENTQPINDDAANINLLYQATLDTVENNLPSINSGPDMSKFASQFVAKNFTRIDDAMDYADSLRENLNIGHSEQVVPVVVNQYLELVKHRLMRHIAVMSSPGYRNSLMMEITNQLAIREQFSARVRDLEAQIPKLHKEGVSLLTSHLKMLGIQADSPSGFFSEARKLIREQAMVESNNMNLKQEIGELLTIQRDLKERIREKEAMMEAKRQQEALLALTNSQVLERLLFQQQNQYLPHSSMPVTNNNRDVFQTEYNTIYSPISRASTPDTNQEA